MHTLLPVTTTNALPFFGTNMTPDPYADRSFDDLGDPLCTAPDELPAVPPFSDGQLFAFAADLTREYSTTLPPALPETV